MSVPACLAAPACLAFFDFFDVSVLIESEVGMGMFVEAVVEGFVFLFLLWLEIVTESVESPSKATGSSEAVDNGVSDPEDTTSICLGQKI